jgi:hypothetical protein
MISAKKENIQGKFGPFEAWVVSGDTKPIMNSLKNMGFRWYASKLSWWIAAKNITPTQLNSLASLGVNVSGSSITAPVAPQMPVAQNPNAEVKPSPTPQKQWATEDEDATRWYGFPINKNILNYDEVVNVDGKDYTVNVSVDRSFVPGKGSNTYTKTKSREHKGLPRYVINTSCPEANFTHINTSTSKEKWGTYNEETFLNDTLKPQIKEILNSPTTKLRRSMSFEIDILKRTPEYKKFLNDIKEKGIAPEFDFVIDDPVYGGTIKITLESWTVDERSHDIYVKPILNRPDAPHYSYSGTLNISNTYTIEDFNNKIKQQLAIGSDKHDKIQEYIIKYLKSFPYLESQQQTFKESAKVIMNLIDSDPSSIAPRIFEELKNRNYIRPHKRQKQSAGLSTGDEIKWVIESKKIVNEAYGSDAYLSHTPEFFYTVVAYRLHRYARNISTFTDMMLVDAISDFTSTMKRNGFNLDFREISHKIDIISMAILKMIQKDMASDEESGYSKPSKESITSALRGFADFAEQHGVDTENLENNVKNIYRSLAKQLHPDLYTDPAEKDKKTKEFQQLQAIYDELPSQYKAANNWYNRIIISQNIKDALLYSIKSQRN